MKNKKIFIVAGIIIGIVLLIYAVTTYTKNKDFANKMYVKCLDEKTSSIRIDSLYSDSYEAVQDCEKVRSKAFFGKRKYDKCINDEQKNIGSSFKEYIDYLYGGYSRENGCTGYYLCRPYEEFANNYKNENDALLDAQNKMESKCIGELLK